MLERTIPITLAKIDDERRITEKALWTKFENERPRLFGALLDAVSIALKKQESVTLAKTPRMADFAVWVVAASEKLGFTPEEFIAAYAAKRDELHASVVESSLIARLVKRIVAKDKFHGTAGALLAEFELMAEDKEKKSKVYPQTPKALANGLRRIAPNLRGVGYVVDFMVEGKNRDRNIHLEWVGTTSSAPSATTKNKEKSAEQADDGRRWRTIKRLYTVRRKHQ